MVAVAAARRGGGGGTVFLISNFFCRVLSNTRQRFFAECARKSTRQKAVCQCLYTVSVLPCVTHGKHFAVGFSAFAVCPWHTATEPVPVVPEPNVCDKNKRHKNNHRLYCHMTWLLTLMMT